MNYLTYSSIVDFLPIILWNVNESNKSISKNQYLFMI